ncbi:hypothetical protein OGAPHI_001148 [Ogataea philodendri]|uniref:Uncharacterized protein n=1 Tax=Ogataea philodendri TaxID=1378263 RepID=A0A9P8PE73_9ASCO|nr:uncharacterized protein OGAPHI_001148 [Ogataea philodendri]KAH3670633.1 hypothetical protein OGAPHI_001148 [Ogataea philodendri]
MESKNASVLSIKCEICGKSDVINEATNGSSNKAYLKEPLDSGFVVSAGTGTSTSTSATSSSLISVSLVSTLASVSTATASSFIAISCSTSVSEPSEPSDRCAESFRLFKVCSSSLKVGSSSLLGPESTSSNSSCTSGSSSNSASTD